MELDLAADLSPQRNDIDPQRIRSPPSCRRLTPWPRGQPWCSSSASPIIFFNSAVHPLVLAICPDENGKICGPSRTASCRSPGSLSLGPFRNVPCESIFPLLLALRCLGKGLLALRVRVFKHSIINLYDVVLEMQTRRIRAGRGARDRQATACRNYMRMKS